MGSMPSGTSTWGSRWRSTRTTATAHGLLGELADKGKWRMPAVVIDDHRGDAGGSATLALYHARRDKIPETAQAHWQLAEWCDQNGLKAEATAHLTAVVRLNPGHEEAWKKLGYQQAKGPVDTAPGRSRPRTWRILERSAGPTRNGDQLLQKWNGWLEKKARQADAEAAMALVRDPRAVPPIWKVFIVGRADDQERAVRLLAQNRRSSRNSRALASLAVPGVSDEVRHAAAVALLRRDPSEFAAFLISLLRDPIEYEVRQVNGPGKPGELYVHGQKANSRFFYAAPPPLATLSRPTSCSFDYDGLPVADRVVGYMNQPIAAAVDPLLPAAPDLTGAPAILRPRASDQWCATRPADACRTSSRRRPRAGYGRCRDFRGEFDLFPKNTKPCIEYATGRRDGADGADAADSPGTGRPLMVHGAAAGRVFRAKLEEDVASLDRYNNDVTRPQRSRHGRARNVARRKSWSAAKGWVKWWTALVASFTSASPTNANKNQSSSKTTVEKRAILPGLGSGNAVLDAFRQCSPPRLSARGTWSSRRTLRPALGLHAGLDGTPDRTPARQETLVWRHADVCHGNRAVLGGRKRLEDGPRPENRRRVRGLGDVGRLTAIDDAGVRPVYHVRVAPGRGVIVGERGLLAHDERVALPAVALFDAGPTQDKPTRPGRERTNDGPHAGGTGHGRGGDAW